MAVIRNKLNQRLIINLTGGKSIDLLAKGTTNVSEKELSSPYLQAFITRGDVIVIHESQLKGSKEMEKHVIKKQVKAKNKKKLEK
jgi:hypothetical protein